MRELAAITDEAEQAGLRFLVIGGLAVSAYGHVRSTADADFAIPRRDLDAWKALLSKFGYSVVHEQSAFAQFSPSFTTMWPVDLMLLTDVTFEKLNRTANIKNVVGKPRPVPSALHLIAMKFHAVKHGTLERRDQDLRDITELIRLEHLDVNAEDFRAVCREYGTPELDHEIRKRLQT
jgi:hypothetical protein